MAAKMATFEFFMLLVPKNARLGKYTLIGSSHKIMKFGEDIIYEISYVEKCSTREFPPK